MSKTVQKQPVDGFNAWYVVEELVTEWIQREVKSSSTKVIIPERKVLVRHSEMLEVFFKSKLEKEAQRLLVLFLLSVFFFGWEEIVLLRGVVAPINMEL